jgi:ABC-type cobalt transport system substrate-binding protein
MNLKNETNLVIILLGSLFALLSILVFFSEGFYGGSDSIAHFRISHFAFRYPHLFFDHWGKPVFTIASSLFSQIGFKGIQLYNIVSGLLTCFVTYKTVKILNERNALLVIVFVVFAPVYFILFFSGLTEITFSLILIIGVYLILKQKNILAALALSFLPFARTEGIVILVVFIFFFLIYRKYKSLPFFLTGFLFFSISGWAFHDDFLWVIYSMPYTGAQNIYGSGSLFHFVNSSPEIFGIPLVIVLIVGIISLGLKLVFKKESDNQARNEFLYIFLPFFAYFLAHSFVWWKGIGGSLGLTRVMAGILPLVAILGVKGYNFIEQFLKYPVFRRLLLPLIVILPVVFMPFNMYKVPMQLDSQHKLLKEAAQWVKSSPYFINRIYYYDLFFCSQLGIDPFDSERCFEKVPYRNEPGKEIPSGSLVQWDAHYGPNEGGMPVERLLNSDDFTLIKKFEPETPFQVLGGYDYTILLFERK